MNPSSNGVLNNSGIDNNSQIRQANTPPITSNSSQSSSPSGPTLLVIDDNSNSADSTSNTTNIPPKPMITTTAQISHTQIAPIVPPSIIDIANGTPEQHRRRNSSIAKLLGGHPLNNQQYEEINQQIIDDQTTQNINNNGDNGIDSGIQRSRSSITRTLLMNAERNNNNSSSKVSTKVQTTTSPPFSKDFEYLIRQELDAEHVPSTLQRHSSTPSVFQNLNSPNNTNAQSPTQSKLKRKRSIPRLLPGMVTSNKHPTNAPPFALHEPFELESSSTNTVPPVPRPHLHPHQNELLRFDASTLHRHANQQQYGLPANTSAANQSPFPYHKMNSLYNQFSIHHDRANPTNCSSSCNCPRYPPPNRLTLPSPASALSPPATITHNNNNMNMTSARKAKSMFVRPDLYNGPRPRSYSNISNQSNSSASSEPSVPLKKRLLQTYKNEQRPTSSL